MRVIIINDPKSHTFEISWKELHKCIPNNITAQERYRQQEVTTMGIGNLKLARYGVMQGQGDTTLHTRNTNGLHRVSEHYVTL